MLQRFTQLIQQYELYLSQNQIPAVKACERQLAYLVTVANSLFSYGMPAGMIKNNRSSARRASSQDYNVSMGGMAESYKAAVLRETEL